MKLHDYTEQLLSLYNFYDGGIMVNKDCVIEYYHNNRPDINTLSESEMIGKMCIRDRSYSDRRFPGECGADTYDAPGRQDPCCSHKKMGC